MGDLAGLDLTGMTSAEITTALSEVTTQISNALKSQKYSVTGRSNEKPKLSELLQYKAALLRAQEALVDTVDDHTIIVEFGDAQ